MTISALRSTFRSSLLADAASAVAIVLLIAVALWI